jgi:hypothetical protein
MNDLALSEETAVSPADIFVDGQSITEFDLEETCRGIVARLQETSDTTEIEQAVTNFNGVEKLVARAKSKLIFEWSCWYKTNSGLDNFAEWYTQKFGGETLTVQKHQAIGELLSDDEVPDNVKQLNTKELVSVSRAKQSGYDLTEVWEELAHAGSEGEVNAIVRKVKGKPERTGTLSLSLQPDGSITAWMGNTMVTLGWLNVVDRDNKNTSPEKRKILEIGISRITNNSRMKVK